MLVSECTALPKESLKPCHYHCLLQAPLPMMTTWEMLNPTSFMSTAYLRCLKLSITPGSFILYRNKAEAFDAPNPRVGRILEVVDSIDKVPGSENFPAIQEPFQVAYRSGENEGPLQFVRVNVFKSRSMFSEREFPVNDKFSLQAQTAVPMVGRLLFNWKRTTGFWQMQLSTYPLSFQKKTYFLMPTMTVKECAIFLFSGIVVHKMDVSHPCRRRYVHPFQGSWRDSLIIGLLINVRQYFSAFVIFDVLCNVCFVALHSRKVIFRIAIQGCSFQGTAGSTSRVNLKSKELQSLTR